MIVTTTIITFLVLTSTLADLSVAPPEDSDEGGSVMRSGPDVVILPEENVVTVLHTAETTNTHKLKQRSKIPPTTKFMYSVG